MQRGKYLRIDLVGLHAGVSDRLDELRICDGDSLHERTEKPFYRGAVAGRLDDDLVACPKRSREVHEPVVDKIDTTLLSYPARLQDRYLGE